MSFDDWLKQYMKTPARYLDTLRLWSDVFGRDNIIVRCYEKQQLPQGLEGDFFALFGIDASLLRIRDTRVNVGFDRETLEMLFLSRELLDGIHDNRLERIFAAYNGGKECYQSYDLLTPEARAAIIELHQAENRTIAREYLGEDRDLFSNVIADTAGPAFQGLKPEVAVPFLSRIILDLDNKLRELKTVEDPRGGYQRRIVTWLREILNRGQGKVQ